MTVAIDACTLPVRDATAEAELRQRNLEVNELNVQLSRAQAQLVQSEKLASIGQLAAGVAHEINNPISFVFSNFRTLEGYLAKVLQMLTLYAGAEQHITCRASRAALEAARAQIEMPFLMDDIPQLMNESREGISRVRKIVQDLKDFSRIDANHEWQWTNLHQGIDSTLNIVSNEIKYKADVVKEYGDIPEIECLPSQINQVVMNLLVNGAQAITNGPGRITIRTGRKDDLVWIEVADTGSGIDEAIQSRVFDPFFTTKPIGSGTGLGLSLSYGIIRRHHGRIGVESKPGHGATFRIELPIRHDHAND